jgi:hypothetical protein
MRDSFLERCSKFQTVNAGDYTFGVDEIRPLIRIWVGATREMKMLILSGIRLNIL